MAIKTTNQQNQASAWMNVEVIGKNGDTKRLRVGIPLEEGKRLDDLLMQKAKEDPDHIFQLQGVINFVTDDDFEL